MMLFEKIPTRRPRWAIDFGGRAQKTGAGPVLRLVHGGRGPGQLHDKGIRGGGERDAIACRQDVTDDDPGGGVRLEGVHPKLPGGTQRVPRDGRGWSTAQWWAVVVLSQKFPVASPASLCFLVVISETFGMPNNSWRLLRPF